MEQRYPRNAKSDDSKNPAIRIYGNRVYYKQTIYEYLIEFLLIFVSAKDENGNGKLRFHMPDELEAPRYFVEPRNGFRRFVFYEQARKEYFIPADEEAYQAIREILKRRIDAEREQDKEKFLSAARDLFYGYAAVSKKRSWCAQELLPLCPEMILCEQMPKEREREKGVGYWKKKNQIHDGYDEENTFADASFAVTNHNYLAGGGEIYYLHILQALEEKPESKAKLELLIRHLLTDKKEDFHKLARWIQDEWEKERNIDPEFLKYERLIGYIPAGAYVQSGQCAVEELINYLSNRLHPVKRIEILVKGVMFQIMRMQTEQTARYLNTERFPMIVDMRSEQAGTVVRQAAAKSFDDISDAFTSAIQKYLVSRREYDRLNPEELKNEYKLFHDAKKESFDVFKAKGKEMRCVIPSRGPYERFSLSEDIIRFLTLSIIPPGERMDLDMFLDILYQRYCLVIGPKEYARCHRKSDLDPELAAAFQYNKDAFQNFLKAVGFLRDLSDATSIVANPYERVDI